MAQPTTATGQLETVEQIKSGQQKKSGGGLLKMVQGFLPAAGVAVIFIALWSIAIPLFNIQPYILPTPLAVLQAAIDMDTQWGTHIYTTTVEIVGGFIGALIVGVLLGAFIAWSPWIRRAFMPLLVFVNILPKVALAPMFLVWIGYGIAPTIFIAALLTFFPVVINTTQGLVQIDDDFVDLGKVMNAPTWKIFAKVRFPNALPYIFSAAKVGITMSVTGAIIGEFVAAQKGLGFVIASVQSSLRTDIALASMLWLSIVGLLLYGLVAVIAKLVAPWAHKE